MPGEVNIGDTTAREIGTEIELDPVLGERRVAMWEGTEDDLVAQGHLFMAEGLRSTITPFNGPISRMRVFLPDSNGGGGGGATYVDSWSRRTSMVQEDIRNNPRGIALIALEAGVTAADAAWTINSWYKDAKDKIKAGLQIVYAGTQRQAFFELLSRGADAYLTRRIVLRRTRHIFGNQVAESSVNAVEQFYSTAKLRALYDVPNVIGNKLPVAGADTPQNTAWGWMEHTEDSEVDYYNRAVETKDWIFAAWSTFLYEYVDVP
jgi:hypothetical protein